jgi:hypothetical protein
MNEIYNLVSDFKRKYPKTVAWRLKQHSKIAAKHLNPDEKVTYAFACQKNLVSYEIFRTFVVVITNKRILIAQKRLLFGYLFITVTPDLYNDLTVMSGLLWGKIDIDTVKEVIQLSNIDKKALPEIETQITEFMIEAKKEINRESSI